MRKAVLEGDLQRELDLARGGDGLSKYTKTPRCPATRTHEYPCTGPAKVHVVEQIEELSPELQNSACILSQLNFLHE